MFRSSPHSFHLSLSLTLHEENTRLVSVPADVSPRGLDLDVLARLSHPANIHHPIECSLLTGVGHYWRL